MKSLELFPYRQRKFSLIETEQLIKKNNNATLQELITHTHKQISFTIHNRIIYRLIHKIYLIRKNFIFYNIQTFIPDFD
jgi:hypothetical protein